MCEDKVVLKLDAFEKISSCPACKSNDVHDLGELDRRAYIEKTSIFIDVNGEYGLMKCERCGLVFRNYFTRPETERKLQSLWIDSSNRFRRWRSDKNSGSYRLKKIIDEFSREFLSSQRLKLVDLGIGEGDFLELFIADYDTYGFEKFPIKSVDYGSIVNSGIIFGDLEDEKSIPYAEEFHLVTALDIFEHLRFPEIAIKNIRSMLVDGGLLFIETGNIDCFAARATGLHRWWYVAILEHKIFWSPHTISAALESAGFRVIKVIKKAHKSGLHSRQKLVIKFLFHKAFPKFYVKTMKYLKGGYLQVPEFRMPWRDHFLVIAQKVEQ